MHDARAEQNTLPFQGVDPAVDMMRLDRYVELASELRTDPQNVDAIMGRFGLQDVELRGRIQRLWQIRFQSNSELRRRFDELVEQKLNSKR